MRNTRFYTESYGMPPLDAPIADEPQAIDYIYKDIQDSYAHPNYNSGSIKTQFNDLDEDRQAMLIDDLADMYSDIMQIPMERLQQIVRQEFAAINPIIESFTPDQVEYANNHLDTSALHGIDLMKDYDPDSDKTREFLIDHYHDAMANYFDNYPAISKSPIRTSKVGKYGFKSLVPEDAYDDYLSADDFDILQENLNNFLFKPDIYTPYEKKNLQGIIEECLDYIDQQYKGKRKDIVYTSEKVAKSFLAKKTFLGVPLDILPRIVLDIKSAVEGVLDVLYDDYVTEYVDYNITEGQVKTAFGEFPVDAFTRDILQQLVSSMSVENIREAFESGDLADIIEDHVMQDIRPRLDDFLDDIFADYLPCSPDKVREIVTSRVLDVSQMYDYGSATWLSLSEHTRSRIINEIIERCTQIVHNAIPNPIYSELTTSGVLTVDQIKKLFDQIIPLYMQTQIGSGQKETDILARLVSDGKLTKQQYESIKTLVVNNLGTYDVDTVNSLVLPYVRGSFDFYQLLETLTGVLELLSS